MKIKGRMKNWKALPVLLCFGALGLLVIALRFYQSASLIDPATGFFTAPKSFSVVLYYVLLGLLVVGAPLALYLTPLSRAEGIAVKRNIPLAVGSLVMAASILVDCGQKLRQQGFSSETVMNEESVRSLFTGERLLIAYLVLGVLSCLSLLFDAFCFATGNPVLKKLKVVRLIPALWAGISTLHIFTITVSYLNNSTLLLEIFSGVTLMLFLYAFARKVSSVAGDENSPFFFAAGLLACTFLLASALPMLFGVVDPIAHCTNSFTRVLPVVYILTAMAAVLKDRSPAYGEAPDEPAASLEAQAEHLVSLADENGDEA